MCFANVQMFNLFKAFSTESSDRQDDNFLGPPKESLRGWSNSSTMTKRFSTFLNAPSFTDDVARSRLFCLGTSFGEDDCSDDDRFRVTLPVYKSRLSNWRWSICSILWRSLWIKLRSALDIFFHVTSLR